MTTAQQRRPEPRRIRLTVPQADQSVLEWLDQQDDTSASMRALIRESIARDGYVDVINRPVEQQPKRGRPLAVSDEQSRPQGGPGEQSSDEQSRPQAVSDEQIPTSAEPEAAIDRQPAEPVEPESQPTQPAPGSIPAGMAGFLTGPS